MGFVQNRARLYMAKALRINALGDHTSLSSPPEIPFYDNDTSSDIRLLTQSSHDAGTLLFLCSRENTGNFSNNCVVPKVIPNQAEACACAEAEPPHSPVDSPQDQQHHQVRLAAAIR